MRVPVTVIRAVSFLLFGGCLFLAAGGGLESLADYHFKRGDYEKAAFFSKRSLRFVPDNSASLYLLGLSSWKRWLQTKKNEDFAQAEHSLAALTRYHPRDAKGGFYKGLLEKQKLLEQKSLTLKDRLKLDREFKRVQLLEPYSPWLMVQTSLERLELLPVNPKAEQTRQLMRQLRWALQQHYIHQSSPYLEEVYRRLLKSGYGADVLQRVTPKEAQSYSRLLEFYKLNRLYEAYSKVEPQATVLNRKLNGFICDQADNWLAKGAVKRAEAAYRSARGKMPLGMRAAAGQLAAHQAVDAHTGASDILKTLEDLLLQEEEDLSFYWEYLEPVIQASGNDFLKGLLFYRKERYSEAVTILQNIDAEIIKPARRYLARALIEVDRFQEAALILRPLLDEEQPDFREILLLQRLADREREDDQQRIQEKIKNAITRRLSYHSWWSETVGNAPLLKEGEFSGVSVQLQPGRVKIGILMKLEADTSVRLARVRVWENDREQFSGAVAVTPHWQKNIVQFETTGGWRWVQVELEKESSIRTAEKEIAQLRLGSVWVEFPE